MMVITMEDSNTQLDWNKVTLIRLEYRDFKTSHTELAKKYNTSPATIGRVLRNEVWVESNKVKKSSWRISKPQVKLSYAKAEKIRELYEKEKWPYRHLADKFRVSPSTIGRVIRRETWVRGLECSI